MATEDGASYTPHIALLWSAGIGTHRVLLTLHSSGVRDVGATEAGVQEVRSIARAIDEGIATWRSLLQARDRDREKIPRR